MIPDWLLYVLAVIGAVVVIAVVLYAGLLVFGLVLLAVEWLFDRMASVAFHVGGGRGREHEGGHRHPKPPLDRAWIEALWLKRWVRWLIRELGYSKWNNTTKPDRPDIERLHELRKEHWGSENGE